MRLPLPILGFAALLTACAAAPKGGAPAAAAVLLHGEQHDAPSHHRAHHERVLALTASGQLAALALEMVEAGASTAGLRPDASEAQVRGALRWNTQAWPWPAYAPAVMAAVRSGVPVVGANLPVPQMRAAMDNPALDATLPAAALATQREAVRSGHCGLLPEARIAPMTRVQIARDRNMAQVLEAIATPGRTVLLLAGAGHVRPAVGVPLHLPATLSVQAVELPAEPTGKDYCAELRRQMGRQTER